MAMLQRGDEQRRRSMNELKCLYNIGKAAETTETVEKFLSSIVEIIPHDLNHHGEINLIITIRGNSYSNARTSPIKHIKREEVIVAGEVVGNFEVAYPKDYNWDKKSNHFVKTLAERIGGAIHSIELEQSLRAIMSSWN